MYDRALGAYSHALRPDHKGTLVPQLLQHFMTAEYSIHTSHQLTIISDRLLNSTTKVPVYPIFLTILFLFVTTHLSLLTSLSSPFSSPFLPPFLTTPFNPIALLFDCLTTKTCSRPNTRTLRCYLIWVNWKKQRKFIA